MEGDLDKFAIRRYSEKYYQLDLNDVQKGSAAMVTSSGLVRNTEWKFHFQVNGKSLTKGSYARFYLAIDTLDWYGNVQGYYVDFGSNDGWIALVRQDGSSRDTVILVDSHNETKLCATSSLDLWITCSQEGEWSLYADVGNGEYALWGKKMDTTYVTSKYVGILCVYTKTNSMNFSFADISVKKWKNTESQNPGQEGKKRINLLMGSMKVQKMKKQRTPLPMKNNFRQWRKKVFIWSTTLLLQMEME